MGIYRKNPFRYITVAAAAAAALLFSEPAFHESQSHAPEEGYRIVEYVSSLPKGAQKRIVRELKELKKPWRLEGEIEIPWKRTAPYAFILEEAEERYGLPPNTLTALGLYESNFSPLAVSSEDAVGYYQITEEWAKTEKGDNKPRLKINDQIDERRCILESTEEVAKELGKNCKKYGLDIALAIHNGGEGHVPKWTEKGYWNTNKPEETSKFAQRVLLRMLILSSPEFYGANLKESGLEIWQYETGKKWETIHSLGKKLGISPKKIKELNPKLLTDQIPPKTKIIYPLNEPENLNEEFLLSALKSQ